MSVEKALAIPELLSQIFEFSDKASNGRNMLVCKGWADAGRPILWRVLSTKEEFKGLLKLLASWPFAKNLVAIPTDVNWDRFLQYASYVRSLQVAPDSDIVPILRFITDIRPVFDLCPNLQTLECVVRLQSVFLRGSIAFLHPGLRRWIIDFSSINPAELPTALIPLPRIAGLVHLEIKAASISSLSTSLLSLRGLSCLETIVLPRYSATYPVLAVLSLFPSLQEIRTNASGREYKDCDASHSDLPELGSRAFPVLTCLTISECGVQLLKLAQARYFPSRIHFLNIESVRCEGNNDLCASFRKIVEKSTSISDFVFRDVLHDTFSMYKELALFLPCNLTRLRMESFFPLLYNDAEINSFVHLIPSIEFLYLNPTPLQQSMGSSRYGTFTLNHFPLFARHCPRLVELEILVDTFRAYDIISYDVGPFAMLKRLHLGSSPLDVKHVQDVAIFLAQLLPRFCQVIVREPSDSADINPWMNLNHTLKGLRTVMEIAERRLRAKCAFQA